MTTIALKHKSVQHSASRTLSLPVINVKFVYLCGVIALVVASVFYAYGINALTGGSYAIKSYNKEITRLQQENTNLEGGFAAAGFMGDMQQKALQLNFEKTTQVKYIEVGANTLAQAK